MVISALQITARSSQKRLHIAKLSKEKKKENETNCQTKKAKTSQATTQNTQYHLYKTPKNRYVLVLVGRKT